MSRRGAAHALVVLVAVGGVGCASSDGSATLPKGGFGSDMGAAPGEDKGVCGVVVHVTPQLGDAPVLLTATASVLHGQDRPLAFAWTLRRADGSAQTLGGGASVTWQATEPGSYDFQVRLTRSDGSCGEHDVAIVKPHDAKGTVYELRVTPPVASGLPPEERPVAVYSKTPVDGIAVALEAGAHVAGTLTGPAGPVAGTVRFLHDGNLDVVAAAPASGAFDALLLATGKYTRVVIPLDGALAPRRYPKALDGQALAFQSYVVGAGLAVAGKVTDDAGAPLEGARVTLRDGPLPSGVGVADGGGHYALRAEAGTWAVHASAPGWPEVVAPNIDLAAAASIDVAFRVKRVALALTITSSDGSKGVGGARVTLRRLAPVAAAAQVVVDGHPAVMVDGHMQLTTSAGPGGVVPPLLVPTGDYEQLLEPPTHATEGVTRAKLTVAKAGSATLALAPRVHLRGTVRDGVGPLERAEVTAVERAGLGAAPVAFTDASGAFDVLVDAGADVDLYVDPPTMTDANRLDQRAHEVLAAGTSQIDVLLSRGLALGGTVRSPAGTPVGGARVEAYCTACPESSAIGVAATGSDGRFKLYVPDPGP